DIDASQYFWRTTQQQEIDLVEDFNGQLTAYEFKWGKNQKFRFPQTFTDNYPGSKSFVITPVNVEEVLLG
ncbi:MAG: DUF4143 domain-containing protein, partial [Chitinophagaceae bacterium]|nr:DUF4143 domain-containing protein [Chitinophagaceae bacterium]